MDLDAFDIQEIKKMGPLFYIPLPLCKEGSLVTKKIDR